MKRKDRFTNVATVVAEELARVAKNNVGKWQSVQFEPALASVKYENGKFVILDNTSDIVEQVADSEYGNLEAAAKLLEHWERIYDEYRTRRSALETAMRKVSHELGVGGRGGSRPAVREDDPRLQYSQAGLQKGRLSAYWRDFKPFEYDRKGETTSVAPITMRRCNSCGEFGHDAYIEYLIDEDGELTAQYEHEAEPIKHKAGCMNVAQPQVAPA